MNLSAVKFFTLLFFHLFCEDDVSVYHITQLIFVYRCAFIYLENYIHLPQFKPMQRLWLRVIGMVRYATPERALKSREV